MPNTSPLLCFKAYDIRGKLGDELNEDLAFRIGRALAVFLQAKTVVLGADVRHSSTPLKTALAQGLMVQGVDVIDIGLAGAEEVYFATFHLGLDGGVAVTASHNPINYNGMKLVREQARPISADTGLRDIEQLARENHFPLAERQGSLRQHNILAAFVEHLLGYINLARIKPMTLLVNAGNGAAGHVIDALELAFAHHAVPIRFIKLHHLPDGDFPNGIPNPMLSDNRVVTAQAVRAAKADMGVAWDGDFDRCFLFDADGQCIEGYYIVGLLASAFLAREAGATIVYDPRLTLNTEAIIQAATGRAVMSKAGHAFIKETMRRENAIYGGEMSAHHYFRDFSYCDSGMIPWLLVCELMSDSGLSLAALVGERMRLFPCSGEINFIAHNVADILNAVRSHYQSSPHRETTLDGLSLDFEDWRFNLRGSNTEPLLRLNIEACASMARVQEKMAELEQLLGTLGAHRGD